VSLRASGIVLLALAALGAAGAASTLVGLGAADRPLPPGEALDRGPSASPAPRPRPAAATPLEDRPARAAAPVLAPARGGGARLRALESTLDEGAASPTRRRRTVEAMAGVVARLPRLEASLQDLLLDRLERLDDPECVLALGAGLARRGRDEGLARRALARLEGATRPAVAAALLAVAGAAGSPEDVAAVRAYAEGAGAAFLPHAIRAAGRLGGPGAEAWFAEASRPGAPAAVRHALADARRLASR
jgi:hypothetical protein